MSVLVQRRKKRDGLPEKGKAEKCERPDCPWPHFKEGYGLAGGGFGAYDYCDKCERVVSKSDDPED